MPSAASGRSASASGGRVRALTLLGADSLDDELVERPLGLLPGYRGELEEARRKPGDPDCPAPTTRGKVGRRMGGALLPPPPRGLRKVREKISWVADEDLSRLEEKPELGAASLSFLTGGGGQLFVGDYRRGFALTAAQVGAAALGIAAWSPIAWLPFAALGAASAVNAWRKARFINRFLAARRDDYDRRNPHPAAYRLLAAMSAADPTAHQQGVMVQQAAPAAPAPNAPPSPFAQLVDRLRKIAALHQAGAVEESEFRARKVEVLEKHFSAVERDQLDDMLYELLPLLDEGVLDDEDIDFIKRLQGG